MKKILLILDSLDKYFPQNNKIVGGANKAGKYIVEYLTSLENIELDIICAYSSIEHINKIKNIFVLNICPFGKTNLFFAKAEEIAEKNNYDIILTNDLPAPFGNVIAHSHTVIYKNKNCLNIFEHFIQKFLRRKKVKKIKEQFKNKDRKIFTVSNRLANDYIQNLHFAKENVICAYPGVEQQVTSEFKAQETFTFGIIAGNATNKGGLLFLLATFLLKLFNKKFKVKMILPQKKKINLMTKLISLLGLQKTIETIAPQDNLNEFYKQIDCLVLPSINETFGLVLTEAASFGKPTLASSTIGSAEVIQDNINGFIFKRTSCKLLSLFNLYKKMNSIMQLKEDKRKEISANAYELSKNFLWENFVQKIIDTLLI